MIFFFPLLFLSRASFPVFLMPETFQRVSNPLPLTFVVRLVQGLWFGSAWSYPITEILVLSALMALGVVISAILFRWE